MTVFILNKRTYKILFHVIVLNLLVLKLYQMYFLIALILINLTGLFPVPISIIKSGI